MNDQTHGKSASPRPHPAGTPVAAIAKAGVCVALIVALAWIAGSHEGPSVPATLVADDAPPAAMKITGDRAAAHRQQLFDERRTRFSARIDTQVAGNQVSAVLAP